ncbi:MAG TPA: hypothetical protein VM692_02025 [Gammaproteobacteria bacterium]|nr:hypothetical protein [Gammaproteobacteria bacterium]
MSRAPVKDVDDLPRPATEPAGKVEFDSRGNSVWRWAKDVLGSTSVLLKRLDNKDLALEPTQKIPVVGGAAEPAQKAKPQAEGRRAPVDPKAQHPAMQRERRRDGGGFDPYNSR